MNVDRAEILDGVGPELDATSEHLLLGCQYLMPHEAAEANEILVAELIARQLGGR